MNNRRPGGNFNDRFNGQMTRKRPWEGGNDDSQAKRPTTARPGNTRFSSNVPAATGGGYKGNNAYSAGAGQKTFGNNNMGGYNNRGVSAAGASNGGGYQPRTFNKPPSYDQKPPMQHSVSTAPPSLPSAMAYQQQPSYNAYQPMQFAQYPMAYAFPPPTATSLMPPLPKN